MPLQVGVKREPDGVAVARFGDVAERSRDDGVVLCTVEGLTPVLTIEDVVEVRLDALETDELALVTLCRGTDDVRGECTSGVLTDVDTLGADHRVLLRDGIGLGHVDVADEVGELAAGGELRLDLLAVDGVTEDVHELVCDLLDQLVPGRLGAVEFASCLGVGLLDGRLDGQVAGLAGERDRITADIDDRAPCRGQHLVYLALTLRACRQFGAADRLHPQQLGQRDHHDDGEHRPHERESTICGGGGADPAGPVRVPSDCRLRTARGRRGCPSPDPGVRRSVIEWPFTVWRSEGLSRHGGQGVALGVR